MAKELLGISEWARKAAIQLDDRRAEWEKFVSQLDESTKPVLKLNTPMDLDHSILWDMPVDMLILLRTDAVNDVALVESKLGNKSIHGGYRESLIIQDVYLKNLSATLRFMISRRNILAATTNTKEIQKRYGLVEEYSNDLENLYNLFCSKMRQVFGKGCWFENLEKSDQEMLERIKYTMRAHRASFYS